MPTETTARADLPFDSPDERDYQAFCDALATSARGRAFLAEYTRRNRNADTEQLLVAIDRLQSLATTPSAPQTSEAIKQELRALLDEIVMAQCELEARILATKTAKLAEMIALVERRLSNMLEAPRVELAAIETAVPPSDNRHDAQEESERNHLAVVPLPEQPELPIPSPVAIQPPSIALVRSETKIAEVAFVEMPIPPAQSETHVPDSGSSASFDKRAQPAAPPQDALATIMALSEVERLALFT
jgi:hypothetical protein